MRNTTHIHHGAVLLEVVLALTIFVMAAGVVAGSMNSALSAVIRVKRQAQASDLAVTKLSEIQMGLLPVASDGPNSYPEIDELPDWSWEVVAAPLDEEIVTTNTGPTLKRVEVIIRNVSGDCTYRLSALLPSRGDDSIDASGMSAVGGGAE